MLPNDIMVFYDYIKINLLLILQMTLHKTIVVVIPVMLWEEVFLQSVDVLPVLQQFVRILLHIVLPSASVAHLLLVRPMGQHHPPA